MVLRLSPCVALYPAGTPPPPTPDSHLALPQLPSSAFGDGTHPTTRLCAGAVDYLCRRERPSAVLDVGTGTGVLARIARSRGAGFVVATDIDPVALEATRADAALDPTAVNDIVVSDDPPDTWGSRFELVVANILEAPLRSLAPALVRALAPGGVLLLSGFTPLQAPSLQSTYTHLGLNEESESTEEGWALLMFRLGGRLLSGAAR